MADYFIDSKQQQVVVVTSEQAPKEDTNSLDRLSGSQLRSILRQGKNDKSTLNTLSSPVLDRRGEKRGRQLYQAESDIIFEEQQVTGDQPPKRSAKSLPQIRRHLHGKRSSDQRGRLLNSCSSQGESPVHHRRESGSSQE